jgi:hypothetical protein
LLYPPWWLLPPLLLPSPATHIILKNIMPPAKGLSTAQPVKTAAGAAIAQKMVVPAAYAGKKRKTPSHNGAFHLLYSDIFLFNHNLLYQP